MRTSNYAPEEIRGYWRWTKQSRRLVAGFLWPVAILAAAAALVLVAFGYLPWAVLALACALVLVISFGGVMLVLEYHNTRTIRAQHVGSYVDNLVGMRGCVIKKTQTMWSVHFDYCEVVVNLGAPSFRVFWDAGYCMSSWLDEREFQTFMQRRRFIPMKVRTA